MTDRNHHGKDEQNAFFPLAFRTKYINRWGLMRGTESEKLLEHSA